MSNAAIFGQGGSQGAAQCVESVGRIFQRVQAHSGVDGGGGFLSVQDRLLCSSNIGTGWCGVAISVRGLGGRAVHHEAFSATGAGD